MSRTGPIFLDPTGRRRRLVTLAGLTIGVLLASVLALLVAGALGAAPVPLPGLPQSGQGVQAEPTPPAGASPSARSSAYEPDQPARPAGTPAAVRPPVATATPTVPPSGTAPTRARGNRPSEPPGNPRPSRSKRP